MLVNIFPPPINGDIFNLQKELDSDVNMYDSTKHSTIGFAPESVFNSNDQSIFDMIKKIL